MPKFSWTQTIQQEFFSLSSLLLIVFLAFLYLIFSIYLLNYRFIIQMLAGKFPVYFKIKILIALIGGIWTSISSVDLFLLMITALLVGLNFLLVFKTISLLDHGGKIKISVGGATILGLVTSGCATCGLSLLSVLGLYASIPLPFYGLGLHTLSILLLIASGIYMFKQLHYAKYCKIQIKRSN